jgi:hypothetical protein
VKPSCVGCRFANCFAPEVVGQPFRIYCHRYAPRPVMDNPSPIPFWPGVQPDEWCGEYERRADCKPKES